MVVVVVGELLFVAGTCMIDSRYGTCTEYRCDDVEC